MEWHMGWGEGCYPALLLATCSQFSLDGVLPAPLPRYCGGAEVGGLLSLSGVERFSPSPRALVSDS